MRRPGAEIDESPPLSGTLGRIGSLEVRLARGPREIWRAQRLRYRVFYQEMSAKPDVISRMFRRDADRFDKACDHLLVIDHAARGRFGGIKPKVVGTYRLMRRSAAERLGGFYTQSEFDLGPMLARHPGNRFLELGRSCVLKPYRTKRTVELLWSGIWAYLQHHRIDAMFGCASFDGTDPDALALPLSFLHHHARSEGDWAAAAHAGHFVDMNRLPPAMVDAKLALRQMPPLIKGYLRLGARFGTGAVIDRQFGTTDVLVVLPVSAIDKRYADYYGGEGPRHAA
ncbi:GNAT family N-acyltransferase [Bosea sp. (in: a-proteobacteria)]|uniref:GNAT family N-acetyltransferase n=1 Tax=Bosea sp. (in: a-proteobacteria) TaxID=1871050 RepID=UPI0025C31473|nr:GNAT family N-acyltransferase [Bosea sp. (in: a-proteobacteria)]